LVRETVGVSKVSKQVYFVIGVDLDDKQVFIDDEAFQARFGKHEQVWDTEDSIWVRDEDLELYSEALKILNTTPLNSD
jgi:hypothetical protein